MSDAAAALGRGPAREDHFVRQPVMRSPAHRIHAAMGGVFERRAAWEVPALYGTELDEAEALKTTLGFADVSARGKVHLGGAVDSLIGKLCDGEVTPLRTATMTDGGLVARLARDWAMAMTPPSEEGRVLAALGEDPEGAMATDITSAMSAYLIAGPRLENFLARSVNMNPAELGQGGCAAATWSRIPAVIVVLNLPSPAIELYVSADHGRYAWETIRRLADRVGGSPVGWRALAAWGWK